jgi:hypothetical protein
LVLESSQGEPLIEVADFYATEGVFVGEVIWDAPVPVAESAALELPQFTGRFAFLDGCRGLQ